MAHYRKSANKQAYAIHRMSAALDRMLGNGADEQASCCALGCGVGRSQWRQSSRGISITETLLTGIRNAQVGVWMKQLIHQYNFHQKKERAMTQRIYCDESGFTGNALLDEKQPLFAYASVATDDDEAKAFVDEIVKKYNIQNGELKGSNLLATPKGRRAVDDVLTKFEYKIKVSVSNKKYALACKFFEYIFEPSLSNINSVFYGIGFHKFIANVLYMEFESRGAGAQSIFEEFEDLMRNLNRPAADKIFLSSEHADNSKILRNIREYAQLKITDVKDEIKSLNNSQVGKWVLDLTDSALNTLLASWGDEFDELTVICDRSKPLEHKSGIFEAMVGYKEKHKMQINGISHSITYNLSEPIIFSDSKLTHGIQIADVVAAAAVFTFEKSKHEFSEKWSKIFARVAIYGSVIPEEETIDLAGHSAKINVLILERLHSRASKGQDVIDGMPKFIRDTTLKIITKPRIGLGSLFSSLMRKSN